MRECDILYTHMKQLYMIIPVYNGAQYIDSTVSELERFFSHQDISVDIVWVDDGSTDQTATVLQQAISKSDLPMKLLSYDKNQGKGHAIQYALAHKDDEYECVGFTDVELPYGMSSLIDVLKIFEQQDSDMVIGERVLTQGHKQYSGYRGVLSRLFRLLLPSAVRHVPDTQCGFKFFKASVADTLFAEVQTHRWVFDVELFVLAIRHGFTISRLPVHIKPSCVRGRGGVSFLTHGIFIIRDLYQIRKYARSKKIS